MGSFSLDIKRFVEKAGKNADTVVGKTVFEIATSLVEKTPVGDPTYWINPPPPGYVGGHARANWSHSEGVRVEQEFDEVDATGQASLDRIAASIPAKAAGKVHYIQNSVPYIQRLEDGWSRQCPPNGMVGLTVLEFNDAINKALAQVEK